MAEVPRIVLQSADDEQPRKSAATMTRFPAPPVPGLRANRKASQVATSTQPDASGEAKPKSKLSSWLRFGPWHRTEVPGEVDEISTERAGSIWGDANREARTSDERSNVITPRPLFR
ncbi:MAG TPA: hypothetical protein VHZ24_11650 [Pirellulales bacterium]|jgi:hypothetical protein|nr:hypothetical protein [Pirellulales bacterium]